MVSGSRLHLRHSLLYSLMSVPIPLDKMEGVAAKRRRVSFGGHLRPELFDENLPPNTPLKKGETPKQRRSLAAHTPTVLKKIIKVRFPAGLPLGSDDGIHPWSTLFPRSSPGGSVVKNPPAKQETRIQSLGWEDPRRREWHPTPVFLPGKSHGQRSLGGCSP